MKGISDQNHLIPSPSLMGYRFHSEMHLIQTDGKGLDKKLS
jgi:hypothetical protein